MFDYSAYSDVGGRANNEDSFWVESLDDNSVIVVADGLGGVEAGELASSAATETVKERFLAEPASFNTPEAFKTANNRVLQLQKETEKKMKTTLSAVHITAETVCCTNVGDTRIYLFSKDGILYQSTDHSVAQLAVVTGEIQTSEIRSFKDKNKLLRALGVDNELRVDHKAFPKEAVDAVLVCSDGFWEYVYEEEMLDAFINASDSKEWLSSMKRILLSRAKEGNDNHTAVVAFLR